MQKAHRPDRCRLPFLYLRAFSSKKILACGRRRDAGCGCRDLAPVEAVGLAAPDGGQAGFAAAAPAVVFIFYRVLPVIILVVALGGVEAGGGQDLGGDGLLE